MLPHGQNEVSTSLDQVSGPETFGGTIPVPGGIWSLYNSSGFGNSAQEHGELTCMARAAALVTFCVRTGY